MPPRSDKSPPSADRPSWRHIVSRYQTPDVRRSVGQVITSFVPYLVLLVLMYLSLDVSYWLTLLLALPAAGFMMRIFIIFHDCGHQSFFESRKANDWVGAVAGVITLTPYHRWRHAHARHHATAGDLDRRGVGDVYTMTVDEYRNAKPLTRFGYRLYRNPLILFTVGAWLSFIVFQRFWFMEKGRRERLSVIYTDIALLAVVVVATLTIGLGDFLLVMLPMVLLATSAGVWLFYVQHQFEGVYWEHHDQWDYVQAALQGSSFYKLPGILQWFTGNIGFHHIHHLSPRIPNYYLERAHYENEIFQQVEPVTMLSSLKSLAFRLYDEENRRLVGFGYVRSLAHQEAAAA